MGEFVHLYLEILNKYNWTTITVINDITSPPFHSQFASTFLNLVKSQKHIVSIVRNIRTKSPDFTGFQPILERVRATSRVVMYFGGEPALRNFLVYILEENNLFPPLTWRAGDANDSMLFEAYKSVLIVNPSQVIENASVKMQLGKEFLRRSEHDYNYTYPLVRQPYVLILSSYMTVFALAEMINNTLASDEKADWRGVALAKRLSNQTFTDDFGHSMYIDSKGQRLSDFVVSFINANGSRETLLRKFGQTGALIEMTQLLTWVNSSFPLPNEPYCGYLNQNPSCLYTSDNRSYVLTAVLTSLCLAIGITVLVWIGYSRLKANYQLLHDPWWQIQLQEPTNRLVASCRSLLSRIYADQISQHSRDLPAAFSWTRSFCSAVIFDTYKTKPVMGWKLCNRNHPLGFPDISGNNELLILLQKLNRMEHINICQFAGLAITKSSKGIYWISAVMDCPSRGALPDIFDSYASRDASLPTSLAHDFLQAVRYIHTSSLQFHGRISILTCWVDKHFSLKLAHLASDRLRRSLHAVCGDLSIAVCENIIWESFYWSPPDTGNTLDNKSLQMVDIYSCGLILLDILTMGKLLEQIRAHAQADQSLQDILPGTVFSCLPDFEAILRSCIAQDPLQRPNIKSLIRALARVNPMLAAQEKNTTLFDQICARMESYSIELEYQVTKRTAELMEETEKCNAIINQILPRSVAKQLRAGEKVLPEFFECATILFTDLHGFADFVEGNSPETTIAVTSATEVCIDKLTTECNVYKVEAISASFMVASGIPERIGINHIERIAVFAKKLMDLQPQLAFLQSLQFKTGIHSGPCAAGLMGLKRPRYCLFGDTINMASRMCSHGLPGRIHLSPDSQLLLKRFSQFVVEERGLLSVKGKHEVTTYWLHPSPRK
ncbi:atrial natriuretic peptide receptor 1-like [Paramacrobiotus metropolitanus]|uniref:atrial natriuretic peptide receptor 1-like n=1 Tax=Paramacrobiotus metropolitanus TaxID=2943436 RepID=UPI002445A613|nr:atrial natriuretic peptide receptor 1-like [Paramacrobiotus metropolitanus]